MPATSVAGTPGPPFLRAEGRCFPAAAFPGIVPGDSPVAAIGSAATHDDPDGEDGSGARPGVTSRHRTREGGMGSPATKFGR